MKPTNETYKKFQELILKSEGKTLEDELGFGCLLQEKGTELSYKVTHLYSDKNVSIIGVRSPSHLNPHIAEGRRRIESRYCLEEDFEILGQPITLERVLRVLRRKGTLHYDHCANDDDILPIYFSTCPEDEIFWQLCKPLHEQTEETLLKLIEILS